MEAASSIKIFAAISMVACYQAALAAAPPEAPPPACVDARQSPDYVPGVDVYGQSVAPADVPAQGDLNVNTHVFAEVRTKNPQVPRVGVEVDLSALQQKPQCPPPQAQNRPPPRRTP